MVSSVVAVIILLSIMQFTLSYRMSKKARCSTKRNMETKSLIFLIQIIFYPECADLDFDANVQLGSYLAEMLKVWTNNLVWKIYENRPNRESILINCPCVISNLTFAFLLFHSGSILFKSGKSAKIGQNRESILINCPCVISNLTFAFSAVSFKFNFI